MLKIVLFISLGGLCFGVDDVEFRKLALSMHNELRARYGSPPLSLDENLNKAAETYAKELAKTNVMKHSCDPCNDYGENLAFHAGTQAARIDGPAAEWSCDKWYNEKINYNYDDPDLETINDWGHFTALIWKETTKMGIGVAYGTKPSRSGKPMNTMYVVARYVPAGNVSTINKMKQNVGRLKSENEVFVN